MISKETSKMENYLEKLKQAVSEAFQDASDRSTIDKMVEINSLISQVETENSQLASKNKELAAAYKDAVIHPGIKTEKEPEVTTIESAPEVRFEDFLRQAMTNKEN